MINSFEAAEVAAVQRVFKIAVVRINSWGDSEARKSFDAWKTVTLYLRKLAQDEAERQAVISIMKNSIRGQRTPADKEVLRKFILRLACIPKELTQAAIDQLCNEIDWFRCVGRSIIFLQGDFGNVYYIIALGEVALYLEPSKDREMAIGREFGHYRGVSFNGESSELSKLGINIVNLKAGFGFGELAILSTANKLRSCAAVSFTPDTFLFVLHADTYNAVMRQHHYRQKQLASATSLLRQLTLFNHYPYSKLSNIAYSMRSQSHSTSSILVSAGQPVTKVLLVNTGQVRVLRPEKTTPKSGNPEMVAVERRLPKLAIAVLGRGSVIGELEMHRRLPTFQMTYVSCSPDCEVFEMPASVYLEVAASPAARETDTYKNNEAAKSSRETSHFERMDRAILSMKGMMMKHANVEDDKVTLLKMLPMLVDGVDLPNKVDCQRQLAVVDGRL